MKRALLVGFRGHAPRWFESHGELIDIAAVSGPVSDRVRQAMAVAEWDGRLYEDAREMLWNEPADLVLLWPPRTEDHFDLLLLAAERRLPALVEKPLLDDPVGAFTFVSRHGPAGPPVMVMQDVRWQTAALEVKEQLDTGAIGRLYWMELSLRGRHDGFIYEGMHLIDLARFFHPREAVWVHGTAASPTHDPRAVDHLTSLTVGFDDGAVARVVMDWSAQGFHHWIRARLHGDQGVLRVDWGQPIELQRPGEAVVQVPKWTDDQPSMKRLLRHFLDCLERGETPVNNAADHLKTLQIIFSAHAAARHGQVGPIQEVAR